MFSEANALPEVVKIFVNWQDPFFLYNWEVQSSSKKMLCLSEGYELSVAIDKNVKNKWNWKWIQEVDADRVPFRHWCWKFDEPRVATKKLKIIN